MTDAIDSMFADIDNKYPGSRHTRRTVIETPPPKAVVVEDWHTLGRVRVLKGRDVLMFTVGALATALGTKEGNIRLWQRKGYLPTSPYRLPTRMVNGSPRLGKRLFTKGQIESAAAAFEKRGLIGASRIEWRDHKDLSLEVCAEWQALQAAMNN